MIHIHNVSKQFRINKGLVESILRPRQEAKTIKALDSVSLRVQRGQILSLLGPNGAGKTTLIKILCTLILPDSGDIEICGYDLKSQENEAKARIGLVTGEERSLYWQLTGRQNLEFFGTIYNLSQNEIRERVRKIDKVLEIDDLDKPFRNYSTGMKHRLMLARCLISEPDVIFMDEPTRSMDPGSAKSFRGFIRDVLVKKMGKTVFFATHYTREAEELADIIAIIDTGVIKACGELHELRKTWNLGQTASLEEVYLKVTRDH